MKSREGRVTVGRSADTAQEFRSRRQTGTRRCRRRRRKNLRSRNVGAAVQNDLNGGKQVVHDSCGSSSGFSIGHQAAAVSAAGAAGAALRGEQRI